LTFNAWASSISPVALGLSISWVFKYDVAQRISLMMVHWVLPEAVIFFSGVDVSISIKSAVSVAGPGLNSEPLFKYSYEILQGQSLFFDQAGRFGASGGAYMKLHEIQ
jgi:hypothetical protein